MRSYLYTLSGALLAVTTLASPTPAQDELPVRAANAIPSRITSESQLSSVIKGLQSNGASSEDITNVFKAIDPAPNPTAIADAISSVASVYAAHPTDFFASAFDLVQNGLTTDELVNIFLASTIENSSNNINLRPAFPPVYPKKSPADAPYSISESKLRAAIYIPREFKYGKVQPVILIPGTGSFAGSTFGPNFGKLFEGSDFADPVYLNIPGAQLDDIQINSEYVAYAINYISAISGHRNVSTVSWSAGSLNGQWARTYWPSTKAITSDVVTISADLHGTVLAPLLCPGFPSPVCTPAIIQQNYNSTFIQTLRNAGGDSASVPTTSIYSIFDEIVQPQADPNASAFILDRNGVGATNVQLQTACTLLQPGGTLYTHEGVLFNALAFALAKDALTHPGPADLSRIDVGAECQRIAAEGLGLFDVLATEALIPVAGGLILAYPNKVTAEPPIKAYAQKDVPRA